MDIGKKRSASIAENIDNWQQQYYDSSQLDREDALLAASKAYFEKQIKDAAEEIVKLEKQLAKKEEIKKKTEITNREIIRITKELETARIKKNLNEYELLDQKLFHPLDSIIAIRVDDDVNAKVPEFKHRYYAVVRNDNNELVEKEVPLSFLKENLEKEFLKVLRRDHDQKGWFVLDKNHVPDVVEDDEQLVGMIEELEDIYIYEKPAESVKILAVKAIVSFEKKKCHRTITSSDDVVLRGSPKWYVYCASKDRKTLKGQRDHIYNPIDEQWLRDIVPPEKYDKWIGEMILDFVEEQTTCRKGKRYVDSQDENDDIEKVTVYGSCDYAQQFYFDVRKDKFYIIWSRKQISKLCFKAERKKFFGLCYDFRDKTSYEVEVEEEWVTKNFSEEFIERVRQAGMEFKTQRYLTVPVGAENKELQERLTEDITNNPIVKYQQKGLDACAFASLSSAIHYLGYHKVAERLNEYQEKFFNNDKQVYFKNAHRIFEWIQCTMREDNEFYDWRSDFEARSLLKRGKKRGKPDYDLLNMKVEKDEIRWIVLWADDNGSNHAVAVVNNWIFDANCTNALTLNQENLDACCDQDTKFQGIKKGYHFRKKTPFLCNQLIL